MKKLKPDEEGWEKWIPQNSNWISLFRKKLKNRFLKVTLD
jgi:hypothetical protein